MTYGDSPPVIGGTTFRRPASLEKSVEPIRKSVTLAGGGIRAYSSGTRDVFTLSWSRLTEGEANSLEAATRPPFVSYTHLDGSVRIVETEPPSITAIAGTDPVRFSASVTLRQQDPTR